MTTMTLVSDAVVLVPLSAPNVDIALTVDVVVERSTGGSVMCCGSGVGSGVGEGVGDGVGVNFGVGDGVGSQPSTERFPAKHVDALLAENACS
jgi:hypothetical protein